jgi:hypothetical protein
LTEEYESFPESLGELELLLLALVDTVLSLSSELLLLELSTGLNRGSGSSYPPPLMSSKIFKILD